MDKLILIDGNSLLNRAFYAMQLFSTSDGLPTNGVFGFVKLLFKIIGEEKPTHAVVAFDLHAPTFRHKLYDQYKGTRKPMPEELVVQVPVLKELLQTMNICTVEKAGYEADDLIGTLSRRFQNVHSYIYTGDRDSYQLVNENTTVCFTKRGVSDLDRLTAQNFFEKVGLEPYQIVEEKALMGDSSDNIPGVHGIGPKGAMDLLTRFQTVENIYRHLDEIAPSVRQKLAADSETAMLSRTLATIDTEVPLDITLEDCALKLPFPEAARTFFARLEFRSLVGSEFFPETRASSVETVYCTDLNDCRNLFQTVGKFSFCISENELRVYVPDKEYVFAVRQDLLSPGFFPEDMKQILEILFNGKKTAIAADAKRAKHVLGGFGVSCGTVEDVSLLRYMGDSNLRPSDGKDYVKDFGLTEENIAYAVWLAYAEAEKKVAETPAEKLYETLELPLVDVLYEMEKTGVCVDTQKFGEFSAKFQSELTELTKRIRELSGVDSVNLNSPYQLSQLLFDKLGYDTKGIKKNSRDGYSTSADVLERLAQQYEIPRLILRYREIQKLQSTYVEGIRPLVTDGVVHTSYHQTATVTGRLSSSNPNLQNIPVKSEEGRGLRKLFVAREGNVLVDADYSQIELRLLAHFSECKALLKAYREGEDIHAATAANVFGVKIGEVTPLMRRRAKTINFGIIYGMSSFGLSKDLGCTAQEAQDYINKYFAAHPEVKAYMDENVRRAKEDGYVTTVLGRKRYIPEIHAKNFNLRSFGERAAMNMPLQGSAADIIKVAMLRVARRLESDDFSAKLVLQVHDELVLDTPEEERERTANMLKEEMENAMELKVPLIAQVSAGKSWYDAK